MAQYRLNAYDADVYIPEFKGLMQYGDQMGTDLRFSPDCLNVETPAGVLQPVPKLRNAKLMYNGSALAAEANFQVMYVRATNFSSSVYNSAQIKYYDPVLNTERTMGTQAFVPDAEFDELVFVVGTSLYYAVLPGESIRDTYHFKFENALEIPVNSISGTFANTKWSYCSYEHIFPAHQPDDPPGTPHGKTNILVISNPTDGVYWVSGQTKTKIALAPSKFTCVARYAERIWGCGTGDKRDTLYYSRPYSATVWSGAGSGEDPADGGGEIREATFDNDKLVALVPFGDSLIAFSELRAWRITGTDPSNFYIQEQYGNGTRCPNSIAVLNDRIIMLGEHGLVSYDGNTVTPFFQEATHELFRDVQTGSAVACVKDGKYILALCNKLKVSYSLLVDSGFKLLVYNSVDGTMTVSDSPAITSFGSMPPFTWATVINPDGTNSAKCGMVPILFDSFNAKSVTEKAVRWITPWIDLGRKDIQKGGFELYFYPELNTDDTTATVTLKFSMQTEKKTKSKSYVVHALTADERTAGKLHKQKRLHFGGAGRRFRLTIEVEAGNTVPWRLIGGIHIIAETDKD